MLNYQIQYNVSPRTNNKIKYIVIHDTGNNNKGANAIAHYNYFSSGDRQSSADFFVDDTNVVKINDYNKYYTWHCGDGKGKYGITNSNSIGIEMCVNKDGDYNKTVENTVELVKNLMVELNISADNVVRHYDASGKLCPASMSADSWKLWKQFKTNIESEASDMTPNTSAFVFNSLEEVPDYAKDTISKVLNKKFLNGDEQGRLKLTEDMVRILVILDRAKIFD